MGNALPLGNVQVDQEMTEIDIYRDAQDRLLWRDKTQPGYT